MLLFVYTTTCKGFVIFTCRYFKFSCNTTALSQSNCRNFSCSGISNILLDEAKFDAKNYADREGCYPPRIKFSLICTIVHIIRKPNAIIIIIVLLFIKIFPSF